MGKKRKKKEKLFEMPADIKQIIWGVIMIVFGLLVVLSFFGLAGSGGSYFMKGANYLIGGTVFLLPLVLIIAGVILLISKNEEENFLNRAARSFWPVIIAVFLLLLGVVGILGSYGPETRRGGMAGFILSWPFLKFLGFWASLIIFSAAVVVGGVIFYKFLGISKKKKKQEKGEPPSVETVADKTEKPSIIRKIFAPKFRVREIDPAKKQALEPKESLESVKVEVKKTGKVFSYIPPSLDLLSSDKGLPNSGDTNVNSAVIKKTFQNFGIEVTMSEINIGPTVTQYTLKPAEGIKLSKITGLSNDLALSLAAHPIRIEAPIPGRSLVGIEVPNKGRAEVRLKNLVEVDGFQKSPMNLVLALGRDVAGFPIYADLTKMPHLLVAGATGTGKTIFLNSLIGSLLYQPSTSFKSAGPETLRLIMVDPKRVEFPVYEKLPHLLCPVIYSAQQTVNALRWLTGEMERRFEVLAQARARDIGSFNERALDKKEDPLPFIVLVIDELADLMMAKGREIEAGIVRLAQMARAVGIHLVVATQRPSVEVITGLIKANITSRITFQVASQVDSRTIIDTSGAEKLLGAGDMLYVSASTPKPKRIQGAYVSDKEIKKVVAHIEDNCMNSSVSMDDTLVNELDRGLDDGPISFHGVNNEGRDSAEPMYEEAKRVVLESKRASASLLQRRLRVGYARAARLIDILEDKGIVGPAEGAKPREVYGEAQTMQHSEDIKENEEGWEKV
jgi:DNA segregation ATPase FtsK/SpoIIIE, S-DNA-T family